MLHETQHSGSGWGIAVPDYDRLYEYLRRVPAHVASVTLSFAEIEQIVGGPLPPSARRHPAWWANTSTNSHAQRWIRAEWKAHNVDLRQQSMQFDRIPLGTSSSSGRRTTRSTSRLVAGRADALVDNFDRYVDQFYAADKFPNSSYYFHARTIALYRERPVRDLLADKAFLEMVYATLATWGLDRMGVGKRLNDFETFRETIVREDNVRRLSELATTWLYEISDTELARVQGSLAALFDGLSDVMLTDSKLVGVSKTMHHLLPDLVPPMDRAYTLNFFYQKHYLGTPPIQGNEKSMFVEMFSQFRTIATRRGLSAASLKRKWDSSVPKLIDNAIIGFVELNMK